MASNSFNNSRAISAAEDYTDNRFNSKRMRKLDDAEKALASDLLVRCGGGEAVILDAPCGSGRFFTVFSAAKRLHGVDFCENMLAAASKVAGKAENVILQHGDVGNLQFEDEAVDGAFCMRLFHHIEKKEDIERLLGELSRVTRLHVAVSFYRTDSVRYWRKRLRGKRISGYPIYSKRFLRIAKSKGLFPIWISQLYNETQTLVLFKKRCYCDRQPAH